MSGLLLIYIKFTTVSINPNNNKPFYIVNLIRPKQKDKFCFIEQDNSKKHCFYKKNKQISFFFKKKLAFPH